MIKGYSTIEIQKALNIPRERFRSWDKEGYVRPTIAAQGQGTKAVYTLDRVYCVALFLSLLNRGFSRKVSSDLVEGFWLLSFDTRRNPVPPETDVHFIVFGFYTDDEDETPTVHYIAFIGESTKDELKKRYLAQLNQLVDRGLSDDKQLKHIHIVNVRSIIEEVNSALGI
jgi:MerR HTH family regulatory protein